MSRFIGVVLLFTLSSCEGALWRYVSQSEKDLQTKLRVAQLERDIANVELQKEITEKNRECVMKCVGWRVLNEN
ncbi:MAG: hypothetical protein FWC41_09585 [Firmicutes bacterium]|nr:hypothetical protein [Bacillota bacterium]